MESGIARINHTLPELQCPQVCFNYVHQNPVKAGMVRKITDWEFSSARDYAGLRSGTLINRSVASEYVDIKFEQ
jgi:putative transposase